MEFKDIPQEVRDSMGKSALVSSFRGSLGEKSAAEVWDSTAAEDRQAWMILVEGAVTPAMNWLVDTYLGGHEPDCHSFEDFDSTQVCMCPRQPCGTSITMGPSHDPYGGGCEQNMAEHLYIEKLNMATGQRYKINVHSGGHPVAAADDESKVWWTGGGYCAGDPVRHDIIAESEDQWDRFKAGAARDVAAREAEYREAVEEQQAG